MSDISDQLNNNFTKIIDFKWVERMVCMKRIISLVLTFAMITSLFSISVFATNYIVADGTQEKYADMITEAIEKSEYKEEILYFLS